MISHRYRCIFVHIPKTGGTSMEDVIWPGPRAESELWMGFVKPFHNKYQTGGLQHLKARQIRAEVGWEIFQSYFKFTIVRNPWDKAVSQWCYLSQRPDLQAYLGLSADAPLAEYLEAAALSDHVQVMPQVDFIRDDKDQLLVDMIGRFETLGQDAQIIFQKLGLEDAALPHTTRSSRRPDYRPYYDDGTRQRVGDLYARDIAAFGYEF